LESGQTCASIEEQQDYFRQRQIFIGSIKHYIDYLEVSGESRPIKKTAHTLAYISIDDVEHPA